MVDLVKIRKKARKGKEEKEEQPARPPAPPPSAPEAPPGAAPTADRPPPTKLDRFKEEAGKNTKVTVTPNKLNVCFDGVGRIVNQGTGGDHIMSIDVETVVACEARPLRIVVDDANAATPRGLRMCDPNPNLPADDPRYCRDGNDKSC